MKFYAEQLYFYSFLSYYPPISEMNAFLSIFKIFENGPNLKKKIEKISKNYSHQNAYFDQKKFYVLPLGSATAAIRSFLLSVSTPPFGVKNFEKIRVDRPIIPLNISIEIIIFPQIRVNREFFSQQKRFFSIFCARGGGGNFYSDKIFF